ncbi:MAG: phosphoribosylaminoimidazolesuccinocarboxamide synthase [Christensenellales bacterium]|jgi:phosphoribosylaminoimidazole-succinocarboxamide synthase
MSFQKLEKIASGKVREIYSLDADRLIIVTTDRISAFDVVLPTLIPDKGRVLNRLSLFWFDLTKKIVKNHIISDQLCEFPRQFQSEEYDGRILLVKRLKIVPFECIVRGYITGSGWESYKNDGTVCGISLPEGLHESQKLPEPIFTPSTKAAEGHDINVSFEYMADGIGEKLAGKIRDISLAVYESCAEYALERGIIIADTKFEFGLDENGELILADEVLTPDSSRFWPLEGYAPGKGQPSYDKQFVRDWLKKSGAAGVSPAPKLPQEVVAATREKYILAYEVITGSKW